MTVRDARPPALGSSPTSRHFVRSVLSLGLGQGLSWIGGAMLVVLLPRTLGDVNLGRLGFALALASLASLVTNLGTATYVMKEVAREPARAPELAGNALVMRLPMSAAAAGVAVAVVDLTHHDPTTRVLVYALCGWILIDALRAIVLGTLQGLQRMPALAAYPAVANSVYAGGVTGVFMRGGGAPAVALAYTAGHLLGLAMATGVLLRHLRPLLRPRLGIWWLLLIGGLPFFVWQAALVFYGQIDAVLLSILTKDAVVGWYVAPYRILSVAVFAPTILVTVVFPALAATAVRADAFNAIARRALQLALVVSLPMALGAMVLPDRLIALLGYPPAFGHSVPVIAILAPSYPLVAADMVIGTVLNACDRQRQWAAAAVAAAVLNPLFNLAAIPLTQRWFGNGAIGAAAVTTLTELFMMANGLRLLPAGVFDAGTLRRALRALAAALAMVVVVLPLRQLPLAVPVATGALIYTAVTFLAGSVTLPELRQVYSDLSRRRGGGWR